MSGFETRAIHEGQEPDEKTGAVIPPLHLTTTFKQDEVGVPRFEHYDYGRAGTPTRTALERVISSLEGAAHGYSYSSGQAAQDAVLHLIGATDHVLIPLDAYGGTFRLIDKVHAPRGLQYTPVDFSDVDAVVAAMRDDTKLLWVETPTNPMLNVFDIEALAAVAHERNILLVVDNTFATPYLQTPLTHGADLVVHSMTKYIGGHSDVTGGFVATNNAELAERLYFTQKAVGAILSPFDCYLTHRGVKTLAVRMDRHCDNAEAIVEFLSEHKAVEKVLYPGLASHPNHQVATKQMKRYGGMVSFLMKNEDVAVAAVKKTKVFTLAESLGAVESLIEHPLRMTHASSAGSQLEVDPRLIRLSVGIETIDDLIADLDQAL